jgi:hypothetical protein
MSSRLTRVHARKRDGMVGHGWRIPQSRKIRLESLQSRFHRAGMGRSRSAFLCRSGWYATPDADRGVRLYNRVADEKVKVEPPPDVPVHGLAVPSPCPA